jgi:hypothetical protein
VTFRTRDIIRRTFDGFARFCSFEDRIGDTFRWKGENVSTFGNLKSELPKYAVPLFIQIVSDMALTGNMKHLKHRD